VEFFRNTNIDFLGKKWYFLGFSLVFSVAGLISLFFWHHVPLGVDFRGGTLVYVKFKSTPNEDQIRAALDKAGLHNARIQRYDTAGKNEELIDLPQRVTKSGEVSGDQDLTVQALRGNTAPQAQNDLNNVGFGAIRDALVKSDPLHVAPSEYEKIAHQIVDFRDKQHDWLYQDVDEVRQSGVPAAVVDSLKKDFYAGDFHVFGTDIVGPQVGKQLQQRALLATGYSLLGMLIYLWFRFEMIYGVAAVVAVFHDTLITVGAFSLTNTDITLTVIAAILTLIGYSMNDTIVVFDRIRENVKLVRRESLAEIVNRSINQTLSRTILTSGLTFLTVLSLYLFGGEVLKGFSFALVVGILIGTYSSIAVAAPMLVAYQDWRTSRAGQRVPVRTKG
jgi:preprotein translocase subunit SecF